MSQMRKGIPVNTLPRTFQDAVLIALRLGHRYIWIDSLCIIQDDPVDWQRESSRMADIYTNSVLTIAATRSPNGHGGCFSIPNDTPYIWRRGRRLNGRQDSSHDTDQPLLVRHPDIWRPFKKGYAGFVRWFMLRPGHDIRDLSHTGNYGENARDVVSVGYPLLSRAWFFQERILSPRVVHFGHKELAWECCSAFWTQTYGTEFRREDEGMRKMDTTMYPIERTRREYLAHVRELPAHASGLRRQQVLNDGQTLWNRLVEDYTRLKLTKEMDRLPALSGIAVSASSFIGNGSNEAGINQNTYLAGIWSAQLPVALFWTCSTGGWRPSSYRAPTYSWASIEGAISYHELLGRQGDGALVTCEVVHFSSTAQGLDPHGMVDSGFLELRGWAGMSTVRELRHDVDSPAGTICVVEQRSEPRRTQSFQIDVALRLCAAEPTEIRQGDEVLLFLLQCYKRRLDDYLRARYEVMVLVLKASKSTCDAWERVALICPRDYDHVTKQDTDMFCWPTAWFPEKKLVKVV